MFGSKLRAWMEAVRPRKKQHRKEKQGKTTENQYSPGPKSGNHTVKWQSPCAAPNDKNDGRHEGRTKQQKNQPPSNRCGTSSNTKLSRYSANNLSSPESAYSTGYSTDGTSPGALPDYLLNTCNKQDKPETRITTAVVHTTITQCIPNNKIPLTTVVPPPITTSLPPNSQITSSGRVVEIDDIKITNGSSCNIMCGAIIENSSAGLVSPRQRNRIRTNPWLPGGTCSAVTSPLLAREDTRMTPVMKRTVKDSPRQQRLLSPSLRRRSISSSSGSSEGGVPSIHFDPHLPKSLSDDDDCTLNEMMGKYDESYVYEKETDILSDSDPTDCESDIDTGQDGGDEEDVVEAEMDFIDNGSYLDFDPRYGNTGHCSYYIPSDLQRRRSSRRRTTRRNKQNSEKRRRSNSNRKMYTKHGDRERFPSTHLDGSKSAGATPVSVRRLSLRPTANKLAQEECLRRRSNSVCFHRESAVFLDKRDREADMKYQELIGQAEQILRTMNINGLSPRRLPGPANKRVELLRSTECGKPDVAYYKNKITEEAETVKNYIKVPSNSYNCMRFSPKKNHITNFIINNSPVLSRKNVEEHHAYYSPTTIRKFSENEVQVINHHRQDFLYNTFTPRVKNKDIEKELKSPLRKHISAKHSYTAPKSILHNNDNPAALRHRMKHDNSSSDDEDYRGRTKLAKSCPQSEPMRRKVYFSRNLNSGGRVGKTVAFNLETAKPIEDFSSNSTENLRQQVLVNTIQNLKRNLEHQSASLKQAYRSTQSIYKY